MGEIYTGGGLSAEQIKELDNAAEEALNLKIASVGDLIRKMKADKASKDAIGAEVKVLLLLKEKYKAKTGNDWKPAADPAKAKKEEKKKPQPEVKEKADG